MAESAQCGGHDDDGGDDRQRNDEEIGAANSAANTSDAPVQGAADANAATAQEEEDADNPLAAALTEVEVRSLLARGPAVVVKGHPQDEYHDVYRKISMDKRGYVRYRTATGLHVYFSAVCSCWVISDAYLLRSDLLFRFAFAFALLATVSLV